MTFLKRLKALRGDNRGNALALCCVALPVLIGGAGLAVDSVQISLARRELQRAADSAAVAGAFAVNQFTQATGQDAATAAAQRQADARAAATRDLAINNDVTLHGVAVVQNAPASGAYRNDTSAVRVELTTRRALSFLSFFDATPQTITVEATAATVRAGEFCLLALDDSATDAGVTLSGDALINLGCGVSSNSRAPAAITATGSSSLTASPVMAVGGIPAGNFNSSTLIPYSPVQVDPFATAPDPILRDEDCSPAPDVTTLTTSTPGYNPATRSFCFDGWDINRAVTANFTEPTIIYINGETGKNGGNPYSLNLGSSGNLTATNVTIVLTATSTQSTPVNPARVATFDQHAQASLNLTAPSTGPYAGIAMYEDRRAPLLRVTHVNGNSTSLINGALYFPSAKFQFNGNTGMRASCLQLVGRRLDFSGSGTLSNSCSATGSTRNFQATYVRLVG